MMKSPGGSDVGLLGQIFHALGRLEAGQQLNRKAGDQRVADLKGHISDRLADLRTEINARLDHHDHRLASVETKSMWPQFDRWKDIPWRHVMMLMAGAYLAIHGNLSAAEFKALLLKFVGA